MTTPATFPSVPQNLTVSNPQLYSLDVNWAAPADDGGNSIDNYEIFRSADSTMPSTPVHTVDGSTFAWVNDGLTRDT